MIFVLIGISLLNIPESFHDPLDEMLVVLINSIMAIQMMASIAVCIRTIYLMIQTKRKQKLEAKVESVIELKHNSPRASAIDINITNPK